MSTTLERTELLSETSDSTELDLTGTDEDLLARYSNGGHYRPEFKVGKARADVHSSSHDVFWGVWSVRTKEKHRGKGHGRRLMQVLTAYADAAGRGLFLQVYTDNAVAINLYESAGFRITYTHGGIHGMKRYPAHIPSTPQWDRYFEEKAILLERDHEPRLGSDEGVAFFDDLYRIQQNRPDLDRPRHTGSANYGENTRRLSCDNTLAGLREAGWTITRIGDTR